MAGIPRIHTESEHSAALARIYVLMDATPGSPEGCELDALVRAVEAYESSAVDIGYAAPVAAIEFRMEQVGMCPDDLVSCIGSEKEVLEVLAGKRPISPSMAIALQDCLGIPAESLLTERSVSD